jgi:hypothetical protein
MTLDRRTFGFWRIILRMPIGRLIGVHGLAALLIGLGGSLPFAMAKPVGAHVAVAGDYLTLAAALVGVVFAGFALVIALLSDRYMLVLEQSASGTRRFLEPFLVTIGIQVGGLIATVMYRAMATSLPPLWETAAFGVISIWFCYAALDVVVLSKGILAHGATRAEVAVVDDLQRQVNEQRLGRS